MKEVDLEKLKAQLPERGFDQAHANNAWFMIPYPAGRARSLWNLLIASCDAEVDDFASVYRIAEESKDLAHLCGLHDFRWKRTRWHEFRMFLSFVWYDKNIIRLKQGLKDYIEFLCENSRVAWGNSSKPLGLLDGPLIGEGHGYETADINFRLPWRTPEWIKKRYERSRIIYEPITEFYPYIPKAPTEEHDLLLAVDRAVGQRLPVDWRSDFCQDLIVSILSGEVALGNLHDAIPDQLVQFKKEMPSKYKDISLDALIFSHEGGGPTYGDRLVAHPEDVVDEELQAVRLTGRYGGSLTDCQTADDLAERLKDAWDANRLVDGRARTYHQFEGKPDEDKTYDDYDRVRAKYRVFNKKVQTFEVERDEFGGAWSPETAQPEEQRENQ